MMAPTRKKPPGLGSHPGQAPPNKGQKLPAETLTKGEAAALLRKCSQRSPTGARNRALLTVMYRGGLRVSEAVNLRPGDLDVEGNSLRVRNGKGGKSRTVGLDDGAIATLQRWLDFRRTLGVRNAPLLCTHDGRPLDPRYVRALIARLAEKAGIEKRVTPHTLRHTFASELVREGVPVNVISDWLGHSNVGTTSRYLQHLTPAQVIDAARARKWEEPT